MEDTRASQHRQRARMACEPCRQSKRKCNGSIPCEQCLKFSFDCLYRSKPRQRTKKKQTTVSSTSALMTSPEFVPDSPSEHRAISGDASVYARTLESNSGSAFVRTFAQTVDPTSKALFPFLGYNLWLGERQVWGFLEQRSITNILTENDMRDLMTIYASKVHRCYAFLEMTKVDEAITSRWQQTEGSSTLNAVLAGVAAIGCVFSHLKPRKVEAQLIKLAKDFLDMSAEPSIDNVNAWILRTVYLRLTSKPDEAWISSCITLHAIDAAGLHVEDDVAGGLQVTGQRIDPETRRRMFGVARHANVWLSFDLARSRVVLQNSSSVVASPRPEDYTSELLGLLPYTESLDPGKPLSGEDLLRSFAAVVSREHSEPPSVLAQVNLMLCLYRRLYTLHWKIPVDSVAQALNLIERGLKAVHACIESNSPWHHVANIPFQSTCALLAMDSTQSFSLLRDAVLCLNAVSLAYPTTATNDAVAAAQALVFMHQKKREADVRRQTELLKLYPAAQPVFEETLDAFPFSQAFTDLPWFNDLMPDLDFGLMETSLVV